MRFRFACAAFAAGLSAALSIAAPAASAQTAPLNPRVALKVGAIGAVSDAGIFIAQEKGYFTDEGLDVEIVGFKAAPQILPAIATGEVQVSGSAVAALGNKAIDGATCWSRSSPSRPPAMSVSAGRGWRISSRSPARTE
jgi:ABC-type nitrate/sulfonate/bicarbonate transport system substrate-binding protein